jgi:hypothetical protein
VAGVTSAIQTQLNAKANLSGATFTGAVAFSAGITGNVAFDTNTLFVDATNNAIGVGTITPDSYRFGTGSLEVIYSASNIAALALISGGATFGIIQFGYGSGVSELARGQIRYNNASDKFSFYTAETERAGLDSAGQFSLIAASNQILLSSGVNALTLNSGTSAAARTYSVPDVGTTGTFAMLEGTQTFSGSKGFSGGITGNVAFDTNVLFVDATNNRVGVGTASPGYLLHLAADNPKIYLDDTAGGIQRDYSLRTEGGVFSIRNETDANDPFAISAAGAVMLGSVSDSISHTLNGSITVTTAEVTKVLGHRLIKYYCQTEPM